MKVHLVSIMVVVVVAATLVAAQKEVPFEDYEGAELADDPNVGGPPANKDSVAGVAAGPETEGDKIDDPEEADDPSNSARTRFTDQRFARLFPSRTGRGSARSWNPKEASKPKPTLPSFIKSTPPLIKVQVTTPSSRQLARQRLGTTTRKPATTSTTPRPRNRSQNARQVQASRSAPTPVPARATPSPNQQASTPSAASLAARRRYGQNSGISRFQRNNNANVASNANTNNTNSTIPALNPRRN